MAKKNVRLGELLIENGYITERQLEQALEIQKETSLENHRVIGDILVDLGYTKEDDVIKCLAKQLGLHIAKRTELSPEPDALLTIDKKEAEENVVLPLKKDDKYLYVVTNNPLNYAYFDKLKEYTGYQTIAYLQKKQTILNYIKIAYSNKKMYSALEEAATAQVVKEKAISDEEKEVEDRINNSPMVKTVNMLLEDAIKNRVSDIHVEPKEREVLVRFRIDGVLVTKTKMKKSVFGQFISRLKIQSGIDIAETRIPQDGGFTYEGNGKRVSLRVSTLPTYYGEKMVIRLLGDNRVELVSIKELGMLNRNYKMMDKLIHNPNGIILITGPTGSGKTTTIYSALNEVATPNVNVVSVEDPVEKVINNISQVQINSKAGMTFASALRSILRQDPDIIMVGEIRDKETAQTAAQAAITGHLVFSTVHTNDAASTFMRLVDIGVEPYLVASSVIGVVAQRLVRLICEDCKEEYTPTEEELEEWGEDPLPKFYKGKGCPHCNNTGFYGRTSIHEIISVTPNIRELISRKATAQEIKKEAEKEGFLEMRKNMKILIKNGKTTIGEMRRTLSAL